MRKVFSLFLALLMVLTVVPVSVFSVFATEPAAAAADTNWEDMSAAEKTAAYKSLYVDGAAVVLMAYDLADGKVVLTDGAGTWENLVDGTKVTLNGAYDGVGNKHNASYKFTNTQTVGTKVAYTASKITYDANGTPLYLAATDFYTLSVAEFDGNKSNSNCKPVKIFDGDVEVLTHQLYRSYKWVADPTEQKATYIKVTEVWEKTAGAFSSADIAKNYYHISKTEAAGYIHSSYVEWTTEQTEGYTFLGYGEFVSDPLTEFFGGWRAEDKGISVTLADATIVGGNATTAILLSSVWTPDYTKEYTVEFVTKAASYVDTDNDLNTFGANFNFQGEAGRRISMRLGNWNQQYTFTSSLYGATGDAWWYDQPFFSISNTTFDGGRYNCYSIKNGDYNGAIRSLHYTRAATSTDADNNTLFKYSYAMNSYNFTTNAYDKSRKGDMYPNTRETQQADNATLMENTPGTVYAVRVYNKALNEAERDWNHFVDLCAYYGVDVSKLLAMEGAVYTQAMSLLAGNFMAKTFENTTKEELQSAVSQIYADLVGTIEARAKTDKIASLYAPGATGIFLAYNASEDGTVKVTDGSGTWINLLGGENASLTGLNGSFTGLDGKPYDKGWQLEKGSVGYELAWQDASKNYHTSHMKLSSSLLGNKDSTLEMVAYYGGMQVDNSGRTGGFYNASNVGVWGEGAEAELWGGLVKGKNLHVYFKHSSVYNGVALPNKFPISGIQLSYSANGTLTGTWNLRSMAYAGLYENITNLTITEEDIANNKTRVSVKFYSNPATMLCQNVSANADVDAIDEMGDTLELFGEVPADVFAVRTYKRVLTEEERMQNHFVDLVFYTDCEIDVDAFAALSDAAKLVAYNALKDVSFADATADKVADAVDAALAIEAKITGVIGFAGLSAKLEGDSNGLRSMYDVNLEKVAALEAEGYVVEIGAIFGVAKYGETVKYSYSDLTLGAVNANAANMVGKLVYASEDDMGASYVFVEYEAGVDATFAYTIDFVDGGVEANETAEKYEAKFVFRGYMKLTKGEDVIVVYTDAPASFEDGASLYDVAKLLVAGDYAENEMLNAIVDKVEQ